MPFVLHSQPTGVFERRDGYGSLESQAGEAGRRYAEIMKDVEGMIDDHSELMRIGGMDGGWGKRGEERGGG